MSAICVFFSSRRRHTSCAVVTGVQSALPILLRAISGRRPVSGTVIRLEPERTATAAARRCRRAAVGHPGHHALPLAKAVAHLDADLVVEPDLDGALAALAGRVAHPDAVVARATAADQPGGPHSEARRTSRRGHRWHDDVGYGVSVS